MNHEAVSASSSTKPKIHETFLVLILAGVQFSHIMDFMVMMPLGPQLMRILNIAPSEFGLVVSVYTFSAAISCLLSVLVMDRFDRKSMLLTVFGGLVVGTFLCGLAPNFSLLLGARIVTGMFGGLLQAIILSYIGDIIPEQRQGRSIGTVMAAFAVASVIGVPAGLAVATAFGWHAVFLGLGVLSAINWLMAAYYLPKARGHLTQQATPHSPFGGLVHLLRQRNTWNALAVMATAMTVFGMFPFVSPYLVDVVGVSEAQLSQLYLFGGVASFVTSILAGRMVDRFGVKLVVVFSSLLSIPVTLAFAYLGPASFLTACLLYTVLSAAGAGRMTPLMALISSSVDRQQRGSFMTLISAAQQLCASVWSYGGGLILGSAGAAQAAAGMSRFPLLGWIVAVGMLASTVLSLTIRSKRSN